MVDPECDGLHGQWQLERPARYFRNRVDPEPHSDFHVHVAVQWSWSQRVNERVGDCDTSSGYIPSSPIIRYVSCTNGHAHGQSDSGEFRSPERTDLDNGKCNNVHSFRRMEREQSD